VAAETKSACLGKAIQEVTDRQLDGLVVQVRGRDVSIRARAKCDGRREDLRRTIASLPGLIGYDAEIVIVPESGSEEARQDNLADVGPMFSAYQVSISTTEIGDPGAPPEPGSRDHHESAPAEEGPRPGDVEGCDLERAIREASGRRLRSVEIRIRDRDVSINAKASRFWQRRALRRTIESLPCLIGYSIKLDVV
jgi:hypothetical protein